MKSGSPESRENYQLLEEGGMSVWVPDSLGFDEDVVSIDLQGFLWMVNLVVTSAYVEESSGCSGCSGCH